MLTPPPLGQSPIIWKGSNITSCQLIRDGLAIGLQNLMNSGETRSRPGGFACGDVLRVGETDDAISSPVSTSPGTALLDSGEVATPMAYVRLMVISKPVSRRLISVRAKDIIDTGRDHVFCLPSRMTFQDSLGRVAVSVPPLTDASPLPCGTTVLGAPALFVALGSGCSSTRCSTTR